MKAMILAAGRGQRLRPLTDDKPKALVEVRGKTLIERHVNALVRAGFADIVINTAWLGQRICDYLGNGRRWDARISYSNEGDKALETGGGILKAMPFFEEQPFIVVNADIWTDFDYATLKLEPSDLGHLVLVPKPEEKNHGDFGIRGDRVLNQPRDYTFAGIGVYHPRLFAGCKPGVFGLAPLLRKASDVDRLSGQLYSDVWYDVGTHERLSFLETRECVS